MIDVGTVDDTLIEGMETFTVSLSNVSGNAQLGDGEATGTILDNEPQRATLAIADARATEGGTLVFGVTADLADEHTPLTATYTIAFDAGASAADLAAGTSLTGTVTIPAGDTTAMIDVDTVDDALAEATETFTVTLSAPSANAVIGDGTAVGTIDDNDPQPVPVVSIADAEATEGGTPSFAVSATFADASAPITADYAITFGPAEAGNADADDLSTAVLTGTVTIPAGDTTAMIDVGTVDDTLIEGMETFTVSLSNVSGNAQLGDGEATGTILDNDAEVITGTEGRDFLHGTFGNDIINAGGGRDILLGLFGDDWLCGGEEDDLLFGGMGDDIVDPGAGDDRAVCGPGDDTVIYVVAENEGARDFYYGGGGFDTLRIIASGDERNSDAFQTDLERFEDVLARHSDHGPFGGPTFAFSALGLAVRGFEAVEIVDPADFDPCPGLPDDRLALPDLADDALLA
jgi:hypothetical protein